MKLRTTTRSARTLRRSVHSAALGAGRRDRRDWLLLETRAARYMAFAVLTVRVPVAILLGVAGTRLYGSALKTVVTIGSTGISRATMRDRLTLDAEGDAFAQVLQVDDLSGQSATLHVTQAPCGFCVSSLGAFARSSGPPGADDHDP